jgi:signal peptidase
MKSNLKKWTTIVLNIILVLIIVVATVFVIGALSAKQNGGVPNLFGYSPVVVLTNSMKGDGPQNFSAGDLVVIEQGKTSGLKENDVITFWDFINGKKQMNTHRITKIDNSGSEPRYTTKGDNNPSPDEGSKTSSDIVGVYKFQIKGAGNVVNFLGSKWGFLFCLVLPLLLFFIWRLIKLVMAVVDFRKIQNEEAKNEIESSDKQESEIESDKE